MAVDIYAGDSGLMLQTDRISSDSDSEDPVSDYEGSDRHLAPRRSEEPNVIQPDNARYRVLGSCFLHDVIYASMLNNLAFSTT
jgi:hypothetical protein